MVRCPRARAPGPAAIFGDVAVCGSAEFHVLQSAIAALRAAWRDENNDSGWATVATGRRRDTRMPHPTTTTTTKCGGAKYADERGGAPQDVQEPQPVKTVSQPRLVRLAYSTSSQGLETVGGQLRSAAT